MRIFVWGIAGSAEAIIGRWISISSISGFIVSDKLGVMLTEYVGKKIYTPNEITNMEYDAIIVASLYVEEIVRTCRQAHINLNKVIFIYRGGALWECRNRELMLDIFGEEKTKLICNGWQVVNTVSIAEYDDPSKYNFRQEPVFRSDYVRFRTFELLCHEIRDSKIGGSVAELGVFRGHFAYYINREFPDRKTYLFDTFEGFDVKEAEKEKRAGNTNEVFNQTFTNTSVDLVLEKMLYLDNVEIRKGYFPETLKGLEDIFAFVSIDTDFEDSIYNGLDYFYPRMAKGGYIMIHDYNSKLHGVKKAVQRYEHDNDVNLCKVPLADGSGTLVVTK